MLLVANVLTIMENISSRRESHEESFQQPVSFRHDKPKLERKETVEEMRLSVISKEEIAKQQEIVEKFKSELDEFKRNSFIANDREQQKIIDEITKNTVGKSDRTHMTLKNSIQERVFWSAEKLDRIRNKFLNARKKILIKTDEDFADLKNKVLNREEEAVLKILMDEEFQEFYKLEFPKRDILIEMLKTNQTDLLK